MEGLVERGVLDGQLTAGPLADGERDAVAVHGAGREGPEDQQIESALK
jgi:hypothetical protein